MFLSRFSKREKYLLYITLTGIIGVLFDIVVFRPVTKKIKNLNKEIVVQEKKVRKSINIVKDEQLITEEYICTTHYANGDRGTEYNNL